MTQIQCAADLCKSIWFLFDLVCSKIEIVSNALFHVVFTLNNIRKYDDGVFLIYGSVQTKTVV